MGSNSKAAHAGYGISPTVTLHAGLPSEELATADAGSEPEPAPSGDAVPADDPVPQVDEGPDAAEILTPIPQAPPEGVGVGVPVLVGGEDLVDSTATLISYTSPGGPREVLLATVNEDAEAKLMEALAVSSTVMVPVQMTEEMTGRLPVDAEKGLYELVAKAAKSVNHKIKNEQEIPEHTKGYWEQAKQAVLAVADDPDATADEKAMISYYIGQLGAISAHMAEPTLGKIPYVDEYKVSGPVTVTKHVPAPVGDSEHGLPAVLRDAKRIQASIDSATGISSWDGTSRSAAAGKEYLVDLGDGYSAIYRPFGANDPAKHEYSLRGQLEIHAPQGAGHGEELVRNLGRLHLVNRPMTAAEGEWTYLRNNITAQAMTGNAAISAATAQAKHLEDLELQELFHAHAHEAIGLDDAGLHKLARNLQLEAAAGCLPKKVKLVRDAVAHATGYASGAELATTPGYDPTPKVSGGWLTWGRFDVAGDTGTLTNAWSKRRLVHRVGGGGNIAAVLAAGVLASTERRSVMGVKPGKGMSEGADKRTGGANSVFLRVQSSSSKVGGPSLVWDDPDALLARSDYYAYSSDHFGALNPQSGHSTHGMTRDPLKIAGFAGGNNEMMFRHGIDLLGAEAPSRIICTSAGQRQQVLGQLAAKGITHLAGKPVTEVVH